MNLHHHRRQRNMTQAQFAALLSVTTYQLAHWEEGISSPPLSECMRIAAILDSKPYIFQAEKPWEIKKMKS